MRRAHLVVALLLSLFLLGAGLATTPAADAAKKRAVSLAKRALNADKVDGLSAAKTPKKSSLLALDKTGKFPASVFPANMRGAQGDPGAIGPPGPRGAAGVPGLTGAQGPIGPQGVQGEEGDQGPEGPQGVQGNDGPQGPQGLQGIQGEEGDQGPQGPQGPQGAQGIQGNQGPQGLQGNPGEQGPAGPQGPQGVQGAQGAPGAAGADGATGPQGPIGEQGIQGPQGPEGPQGIQGPQGLQGDPGAPGTQGPQGEQGPAGSPDTPAQVLAKLVTVDGSGSGLDADTLDGASSADFLRQSSTLLPFAVLRADDTGTLSPFHSGVRGYPVGVASASHTPGSNNYTFTLSEDVTESITTFDTSAHVVGPAPLRDCQTEVTGPLEITARCDSELSAGQSVVVNAIRVP